MSKVALNRWQLEKNNQTLTIFGISLMVLCVVLSLTLMASVKVKGLYHSGDILEDFVARVTKKSFTFDALSFKGQLEQIKSYMDESVHESLNDSFLENIEIMQEHEIKQKYEIKNIVVEKGVDPFLVKVLGERVTSSYVNPDKTSILSVDYLFEIEALKPTRKNPYGLKVIQIQEYPKDEEAQL